MKKILGALVVLSLAVGSASAQSNRVESLLKQLTPAEKLSFLTGSRDPRNLGQAGYLPGVPRLGIPELRLTDGPAGIRVGRPATALPAPVALASTFSPALAQRFGQVMGREGRALQQDILLSPMVNIVRVPQGGRNFETLGEDPFLSARMVAAEIRAIQGEGLIATVKHYAVNNFERDRMSINAIIDEQTLREIYLPAFEAAVKAGSGSVMGSYNKVNGTFACENPFLLTTVLRDEWGFTGFVMSDWFATHSTLPALSSGMELEMPGSGMGDLGLGQFYTPPKLASVPPALIDQAVRRILTSLDKVGLLGTPRPRPVLETIAPADAKIAREVAIAGSVLLKNEKGVLPLRKADLGSVVVIGPTAQVAMIGGGGSAQVTPLRRESPLTALARRAGGPVHYVTGVDLDGTPIPLPEPIDFAGSKSLAPGQYTWKASLTAPTTGTYALKLQVLRGTAQLTLDGKPLISSGMFFGGNDSLIPTKDGLKNGTVTVQLKAGETHQLVVTVRSGGLFPGMPAPPGNLEVRLNWITPEHRAATLAEATQAAKKAKTVVVFAYDEGTEGADRASLALPGDQDALIAAVAAANPRTVVVLNTDSAVTMPWLSAVPAVLETWFPGQEGADATAALLCGEADPSGRLPVTFPKREADAPTAPAERYPGVGGKAHYSEGIFVGYRHYDAKKLAPLFPFGHGLSYTTFQLSGLRAQRTAQGVQVRLTVKNTGKRAGVTVPQLYLGPVAKAPAPMAVRKLVGFERIALAPGKSQTVTITIPARELAYWSIKTHGWVIPSGARPLWAGFSSRDLPLQTQVR